MQRIITILAAIYLISGCANIKGSDYDQLRRAEQAGARITDYSQGVSAGRRRCADRHRCVGYYHVACRHH